MWFLHGAVVVTNPTAVPVSVWRIDAVIIRADGSQLNEPITGVTDLGVSPGGSNQWELKDTVYGSSQPTAVQIRSVSFRWSDPTFAHCPTGA